MRKCVYCHSSITSEAKIIKVGREKYMHASCFREMYKDFPIAEVIKLCKDASKEVEGCRTI